MGRYIPPAWLQHTEVAEWATEVEKLWPDLISKDLQELEILFVEQCRDRPMYVGCLLCVIFVYVRFFFHVVCDVCLPPSPPPPFFFFFFFSFLAGDGGFARPPPPPSFFLRFLTSVFGPYLVFLSSWWHQRIFWDKREGSAVQLEMPVLLLYLLVVPFLSS